MQSVGEMIQHLLVRLGAELCEVAQPLFCLVAGLWSLFLQPFYLSYRDFNLGGPPPCNSGLVWFRVFLLSNRCRCWLTGVVHPNPATFKSSLV